MKCIDELAIISIYHETSQAHTYCGQYQCAVGNFSVGINLVQKYYFDQNRF